MNEMTINRTVDVIAAEINGIKAQTRTMLLCSSIEIGRRLVEAKGMVEHGQWGEWLEKQIDYSPRTAQNLMKIFEEYGADQLPLFGDNSKTQAFADLTYTQAVALLGVPADDREKFIDENKINEMSTRELQTAIKERDELQKKLNKIVQEKTSLKAELELGHKAVEDNIKTIDSLRIELEDARAEGRSEEDVKELTGKLDDARHQVDELTQKLQQPVTVEPIVVEKIPEDIERELEELRSKSQSQTDPAVLKFGLHFEEVVSAFQKLLSDLAEIADTAAQTKYRAAVNGLLGKMGDRIG